MPEATATSSAPDRAILDVLPDGVLVADGSGTVVAANDLAGALLGQAALVGRPLAEVMALQDLDGHDWAEVTDPFGGIGIRRLLAEQVWHLSDGTELLVTARVVRGGRGRPVEAVGVSLRSARARSRLDRERSDLVATLAHELRSPLTGVKGFTGTLLAKWDRFSDDQKRLVMQSVHTDTDRLTRLIAELLEVARIDTGRLSLFPRPLDAGAAVRQVLASVRAGSARPLVFDPDPALPAILADPDRFAQVVTNLVDNAVRHGEGVVRITAGVGSDDELTIAVEDEGDGIAPELRRRVFTKYWKHGASGGSGLGMYITHGLVAAHGGSITIGASPAGGARIEVRWPLAPPELRSGPPVPPRP